MTLNKQLVNKTHSLGKLIFLTIVAIIICSAIMSFVKPLQFISFTQPVSSEMKKFVLEQDKIGFIYPENWIAQLTPQGNHGDHEVVAIVSAPRKFFLNVLIAQKQFNSDDISMVANWGNLRAQSRFIHYQPNTRTPYSSESISGLISEYVVRTGSPLETQDVLCKDLYFLHEQNGYDFSFCATKSDWTEVSSIFDKMMASIRLLE